MKNLFLLSLALFLFAYPARADLGSCIIYQAKFYLKDGRLFNASFEVAGDGPCSWLDENGTNEYCSDEGIFTLFKKIQKERSYDNKMDGGTQAIEDFGKVLLYKKFHYVVPKGMKKKQSDYSYSETFGFVLPEDLVYVDSSEIAQVIFWQAEYSSRSWLTSEIIVGTSGMLDTLQNQQYWNDVVVDLETNGKDSIAFSEDTMWGYRLINYSSKNNMEELKRLARLKFPNQIEKRIWEQFREERAVQRYENFPDDLRRLGLEMIERKYQQIRYWFWKRGVMMVRINGTC